MLRVHCDFEMRIQTEGKYTTIPEYRGYRSNWAAGVSVTGVRAQIGRNVLISQWRSVLESRPETPLHACVRISGPIKVHVFGDIEDLSLHA